MQVNVYARVVDGAIAEYPVHEIHIKNRAHPKEWYTPVVFLKQPTYDQRCEQLTEVLHIAGTSVVSQTVVKNLSIDTILDKLFYPNGSKFDPLNPGQQIEPANITIGDIEPDLLQKVISLVSEEVGQTLNDFVKTRNYDDVKSCATYVTSTNIQFKTEAERVILLRDQTYSALYVYIDQVVTGQVPVPKSFDEIKALLPELTWN